MAKYLHNSNFIIRSYTKAELGLLYSPNATPRWASRKLMNWIKFNPKLPDELAQTGLRATDKMFTPAQVEIIIRILGEP